MNDMAYRPEIDGLRAIAVGAVVLFHAGVPGLDGGYVGVDVFFVISGYLITGILLRALQKGDFSIAQFYERRIRRIYPALFAVLALSAAVALLLLLPPELPGFGRSLLATSLYAANYHFMGDVGYFAAPPDGKPLLHMWSLAVEEQFYVLFPLLLAGAWRLAPRRVPALTAGAWLASLVYALWLAEHSLDQAFYSTPARAWELLTGATLAVLERQQGTRAPDARAGASWSIVGLAAVLVPVIHYAETTPFPGWAALAPVLGTACLIHGTRNRAHPIAWLLSSPAFRGLGLVSYSLYLWHWPVFVFWRIWHIAPVGPLHVVLQVGTALGLAVLSYRFVETPFRRGGGRAGRRLVLAAGACFMVVGAIVGGLLSFGDGLPARVPQQARLALDAASDGPRLGRCAGAGEVVDRLATLCPIGPAPVAAAGRRFVVWGDSHAEALLPAIEAAAGTAGVSGQYFVRGGCPPLLDVNQAREGFRDCSIAAEALVRRLDAEPAVDTVVLAARWALYASGVRFRREAGHPVVIEDAAARSRDGVEGNAAVLARSLERTVQMLRARGLRVVLVTQVPETEFDVPRAQARALMLTRQVDLAPTRAQFLERQAVVDALFHRLRSTAPDVDLVRPDGVLCPGVHCVVLDGDRPLYRDSNHLTAAAARRLAPLFVEVLAPRAGEGPREGDLSVRGDVSGAGSAAEVPADARARPAPEPGRR